MPLNKTAFKRGLKGLLEDMASRVDDPAQAREDYAEVLSDLIIQLVQSGTVTGTVTTTGSASTQTGPITNGQIR